MADKQSESKQISRAPDNSSTKQPLATELVATAAEIVSAHESKQFDPATQRILETLTKKIRTHHRACVQSLGTALSHAIEAGINLNTAKSILVHGQFLPWLNATFVSERGLSDRTANRYMKLAGAIDLLTVRLRDVNPTCATDLSDEELLKRASINQALRLITADYCSAKDESGTPAHSKKTDRASRTKAELPWVTPPEIVRSIQTLLSPLDAVVCRFDREAAAFSESRTYSDIKEAMSMLQGGAYMNPGQMGMLAPWVDAFLSTYHSGRVSEGLMQLPVISDAEWFGSLHGLPRVFLRQRLLRWVFTKDGTAHREELPHPSLLVYLGPNERLSAFCEVFSPLGEVLISARQ